MYAVSSTHVTLGVQNCRSCRNKMMDIKDMVIEEDIDILFLTETWFKKGDKKSGLVNNLKPPGYEIKSFPRKIRSGGGVGFIMKNIYWKCTDTVEELKFKTFESVQITLMMSDKKMCIVSIYEPPRSEKYLFSDNDFLDEFCILLVDIQQIFHTLL